MFPYPALRAGLFIVKPCLPFRVTFNKKSNSKGQASLLLIIHIALIHTNLVPLSPDLFYQFQSKIHKNNPGIGIGFNMKAGFVQFACNISSIIVIYK
jgi:hypothetical protein